MQKWFPFFHEFCPKYFFWTVGHILVHLGTILPFLPLSWRMEQCHGQQVCSQAVGYFLLAPKHFEVYHQKYEETTEEAHQTSCTWNTYANIETQRETHKSTTFNLSLSTIFSSKMGNKITGFMKKNNTNLLCHAGVFYNHRPTENNF